MPEPAHRAVFLSYAREDAAAARRIAEALRSQAIEVWFDENELRGGEAWDQKIRRQIRGCTLFVAIISAHTQARGEGYFRLEWHEAVERMRLMMEGRPFLVPVVIDDTPDASDMVPEPFQRVHWTRLPGALPTPQFVDRIERLLQSPLKPVPPAGSEKAPAADPTRRPGPSGRGLATAGVIAALVVAGFYLFQLSSHQPAPAPSPPSGAVMPATAAAAEKSIAVLPFENLSGEKDGAFADGVHDQILTSLAYIRELHVTSRTSVMAYRGKPDNVRDIARKLGVAYILEGTVRRAGDKVSVTAQLIRAEADEHVWAKNYAADLSATDMFAIQSDLAEKIASSLQAALSPQERKLITDRPTDNTEAYDEYAKARAIRRASASDVYGPLSQQERLLARAVELDPKFAAAWSELAIVRTSVYSMRDRTMAQLARAKQAMDHALALAPGAPDVIRAHAEFLSRGFRDHAAAAAQYRQLLLLQPNEATVRVGFALVQLRQGQWTAAEESLRRAQQLDPEDFQAAESVYALQVATRHYREAKDAARRLVELHPWDLRLGYELARVGFLESGSSREMEAFFAARFAETAKSRQLAMLHRRWRDMQGEPAAADDAIPVGGPAIFDLAVRLAAEGKMSEARLRLEPVKAELARMVVECPDHELSWAFLAQVHALLGEKAEAERAAQRAAGLLPEDRDALAGPEIGRRVAFVHAWTGEKERAIAEYARLLRVPYTGLNVHEMRRHPAFAPLRADLQFDALLIDRRNNAILGDMGVASTAAGASPRPKKPVLLVARDDGQRLELMLPKEVGVMKRLVEEAGYRLVVTSVSGLPVKCETASLRPELRLADVKVDEYAGFIFPCMAPAVQYPAPRELAEFARKAVATGRPVAAQTSGISTLADAGVMDGKRYAMRRNHPGYVMRGIWAGDGVVEDGNIITSAICPNTANETGREDGTRELMRKFVEALGRGRRLDL